MIQSGETIEQDSEALYSSFIPVKFESTEFIKGTNDVLNKPLEMNGKEQEECLTFLINN